MVTFYQQMSRKVWRIMEISYLWRKCMNFDYLCQEKRGIFWVQMGFLPWKLWHVIINTSYISDQDTEPNWSQIPSNSTKIAIQLCILVVQTLKSTNKGTICPIESYLVTSRSNTLGWWYSLGQSHHQNYRSEIRSWIQSPDLSWQIWWRIYTCLEPEP